MNETLTMKDGTTVRNAQTVGSIQGLWIHIREGLTFSQAYSLFSDPEKTGRIESDRTEPATPNMPTVYEGFTDLYMLKREDNGMIIVGLHEAKNE